MPSIVQVLLVPHKQLCALLGIGALTQDLCGCSMVHPGIWMLTKDHSDAECCGVWSPLVRLVCPAHKQNFWGCAVVCGTRMLTKDPFGAVG